MPCLTTKDAELACHVCWVFDKTITQLVLNTPQMVFDEFSKCLSLDIQHRFDELQQQEIFANGNQDTLFGFRTAQRQLVYEIVGNTALADQDDNLNLYRKP